MFFYTALLLNEIYLSIKFHDDISYCQSYVPGKIQSVKINKVQ
jgi:hypothetical protein